MFGGWGLGVAVAAYAAIRREMMVCPEDECEWKGSELPCWYCGRSGVMKYPPEKESK